jgi:hypothetical protein
VFIALILTAYSRLLNALSGFRYLASTSPSKGQFNWIEAEKLALTRKLTALGAVKCCGGVQKKESQPPVFVGWKREAIDLPLFFDKQLSLMSGAARTTRQDHLRVSATLSQFRKILFVSPSSVSFESWTVSTTCEENSGRHGRRITRQSI